MHALSFETLFFFLLGSFLDGFAGWLSFSWSGLGRGSLAAFSFGVNGSCVGRGIFTLLLNLLLELLVADGEARDVLRLELLGFEQLVHSLVVDVTELGVELDADQGRPARSQ